MVYMHGDNIWEAKMYINENNLNFKERKYITLINVLYIYWITFL